MKIITVSAAGIAPAQALLVKGQRGRYWAIFHGEEGRGRWQWRLPLGVRDFPPPGEDEIRQLPHWQLPPSMSLEGMEVDLIPLGKRQDARGNDLYLAVRAQEPDGRFLILWSLSPGYRGGATYQVAGAARVIGSGYEAQGMAGRMGGAPCPVVVVGPGPATLSWHRTGRLYDKPADWVATWDGEAWRVSPIDECFLEEAALSG